MEMAIKKVDHMQYQEGMEIIQSDMMEKVLTTADQYDDQQFTSRDVERALSKDHLSLEDLGPFSLLLLCHYLEIMAQKGMAETKKHFGNSVSLFTPLYIANYCENECTYCGFKATNKIQRAVLNPKEAEDELKAIAATGLEEILLLTGESRYKSDVEYIGKYNSIGS